MPQYKIYHFKSLTSTQDKAKEFSKKGLNKIIIISDVQTKARGRFKRKWHSSKGGLWMSILLKPENVKDLQYLTFAAAISVVESVKKITKINTNIKWPNDVHYKGKKLCGILTEGNFGKENYVVVGFGLNVNQNHFPYDIWDIATSLKNINKIWKKYCDTLNKNVTVMTRTNKIKGKAIGIDNECNLLLKLKNNKLVKIIEGDLRVRY